MAKDRQINYLSKDFDSIKVDLLDFIKRNYPNDFANFSVGGGDVALIELFAYLGDLLSFNIDMNVNKSFINRITEEKNMLAQAQNRGYKPKSATPAVVNLTLSATFNSSTSANSMFILKKGTRVITNEDPIVSFEIIEDIDFSSTANRQVDANGTDITISVSSVSAIAGQKRTFSYTVGAASPFLKITLPNEDISEIVSVSGSDNSEWFEVDYLARDTVFIGEKNTVSSTGDTPYVMKLKRVPKRFTVEREVDGKASLRFGSGILTQEDSEVIPNPEDFVLSPTLRGSPSGFIPSIIDSTNFLKTKTLGVAPSNISLDINYRYGGGIETNVRANQLTRIRDRIAEFKTVNYDTTNPDTANSILNSLSVTNPEPATGGEDREDIDTIRERINANFFAQERAVTLSDYQARVMSIPSKFGTVFRSYARKDPKNNFGVELIVISRSSDGTLTTSNSILKNNIESYLKRFKSFNDTVRITDGKIINIGIDFSVVPDSDYNNNEALLATFILLKDEFKVTLSNFGATIVIPDIMRKIQSLDQIRSVSRLRFFNITNQNNSGGRTYSQTKFDISSNTFNGIITFPTDCVWEVKYNQWDIFGRVA